MRHTRQGPTWWHVWVPLLGLGGLMVLEHQVPLSPGGHKVAQLALTLLMYGVVMSWLRCNRGALIHREYERGQHQEYRDKRRQHMRERALRDAQPWDDAEPPWQNSGHAMDIQRRR